MSDLQMTVPVLFLLFVVIVFLYRRFRRSAFNAHWTCHVAAAMGLVFGVVTTIGGVGHSVNVAYLAWNEPEYGPLQILRFTTGAMLIYTGATNVAMYRGIKVGRRSAIAVSAAMTSLFLLYLCFTLPLPGTGGTVPPMLGIWSIFFCWLVAAAVTSQMRSDVNHEVG